MPLDFAGPMPIIAPSLAEIADTTPIGVVREPTFRLVADLIRVTIAGLAPASMVEQAI